ncbi:MAG: dihydroxyacetone kinase subunit L [Deltaproteobacteria bacterium]|nr:dihydroxyacetone kinase subunit L [Deltaproteobacteria bacterium]
MTARDFMDYLAAAYRELAANGDYITALDAKTGDGDHWANLSLGFGKIMAASEELAKLSLPAMFRKTGSIMMSAVGGSSGILYGSAYLAAAKVAEEILAQGKDSLDVETLLATLEAQAKAIGDRGQAKPGFKTMLDSLLAGIVAYREALVEGDDRAALLALKAGAASGAEATRGMEAVKGRASYRPNKGLGELDPGAVTMAIQLGCLADYLIDNCLK